MVTWNSASILVSHNRISAESSPPAKTEKETHGTALCFKQFDKIGIYLALIEVIKVFVFSMKHFGQFDSNKSPMPRLKFIITILLRIRKYKNVIMGIILKT